MSRAHFVSVSFAAVALVAAPRASSSVRPADDPERWTQEQLDAATAEILEEIEALRGEEFLHPVKAKIADAEGFKRYAMERAAKTDTPESLAADAQAAELLGLIPPGLDLLAAQMELLEGQVGGFYDPDTDSFFLMETFGGDVARVILSHELTHALDDQLYDIDGTLERVGGDTDAELAFHAVVEGSGSITMTAWTVGHMGEIDMQAIAKADLSSGLGDAPQVLWKPLLAVYMKGAAFLEAGRKTFGDGYLAHAFANPPRSTEQVLHPERYWKDEERDEPRRVAIDAPDPASGWTVLAEDTLGELMLALVTTPVDQRGGLDARNPLALMGIRYTNAAASGWGGDRMVLLANGDARILRLVTVWDTDEDAAEFEKAVRAVFDALGDGAWESAARPTVTLGTHAVGDATASHVVIDVRRGEAAREAALPGWREER